MLYMLRAEYDVADIVRPTFGSGSRQAEMLKRAQTVAQAADGRGINKKGR